MLTPVGDMVLVWPERRSEVTEGGIHIPEHLQDTPTTGIVFAVGDGRLNGKGRRMRPDVEIGDRVMFAPYCGDDIDEGDKTFTLLRAEDIQAVLD